jgi:hypothetical protein
VEEVGGRRLFAAPRKGNALRAFFDSRGDRRGRPGSESSLRCGYKLPSRPPSLFPFLRVFSWCTSARRPRSDARRACGINGHPSQAAPRPLRGLARSATAFPPGDPAIYSAPGARPRGSSALRAVGGTP